MLCFPRVIPNIENNVEFGRAKTPKIDDRKWHCITLILCHLRSSIFVVLARPNSTLFSIFGIIRVCPLDTPRQCAAGHCAAEQDVLLPLFRSLFPKEERVEKELA